jgi:HSP20 family protein
MNAITRWDPFREMVDLQSRLSGILSRAPNNNRTDSKESLTVAEWAPLVDIVEDDKEYLIKVELADIQRDQVKVFVESGILTISGERKFEKEEQKKKYHRVERAYGTFVRTFIVPDDADADKVTAEFRDGVLMVHLPKSESAKPKQIEVKVA